MTRTAHKPVRVEVPTPRDEVAVRWDLASRVGRELSRSDAAVGVEVTIRGGGAEAALVLESGARRVLVSIPEVQVSWRREGEYRHVDAPGVLACTWREGEAKPVYVRCSLLERLGVPAGSYALSGV